ncbi:DUF1934-containing protein [Paucilactobacillus oligofermentans DSM 15707 = LMG 22743]|uniref:DUF1934 domain-containing protein n=1 Tax=Paucilactobacillus oligofermentans TaxID=293371 RepID=UPI00078EB3B1|nr:DUF1934 domain-containing protein [Paucilactobacillus oligofermentans]CUS26866.1 DUF1934-containing protein [Paucilactobacillus oligofermentans DSM 15707 = LMG 22743]
MRVNKIKQKNNVQVKLKTTIIQPEGREEFEFSEPGQFIQMGGAYYLRYTEIQDGIETPVTFKFMDQSVVLTRHSDNRARFEFQLGKSIATHYQSAYGMMNLSVVTKKMVLNLNENENNGELWVDYELKSVDNVIGKYQIRLQFFN